MANSEKLICIIGDGELKLFKFKDLEPISCRIGFDPLKPLFASDEFFFWHKSYAFRIKFALYYWITMRYIGLCMHDRHIVKINDDHKNDFYPFLEIYDIKWINSELYIPFV